MSSKSDPLTTGAVSLGGGAGALARWALTEAIPAESGQWPTAIFVTNISGCFAIGVLMVLVGEVWPARPLLRPFLGVGVLGGFTTFSTYAVDIGQLGAHGAMSLAVLYALGTLIGSLFATWIAIIVTRWAVARRRTT
ncbi:MAG: fluoride efflux transporter CrcB [Corynebacteriales bacterium]|nr:fluoride efflux transporter CrcB [Mycobacteriales bacterium]